MSHRYSLRPHAKGRREYQSADESEGQVKGTTSKSTGTDGILASEGGHDILTNELEDEPGTVESRPTTPCPSRVDHITPAPTKDPEEDWWRRTRYRVQGPAETLEEIQTARKRAEARCIAEAGRIRRDQIVRGYEEDLRALRARIEALRRECEVRVEKTWRKWERDWAIERGEVAVVVEEEEETGEEEEEEKVMRTNREDADVDMAVDEDYTPTETLLTTDDDEDRQWQWPSWSVSSLCLALKLISCHPSSSSLSPWPQQPPHMGIFQSSDKEVRSSSRRPRPNEMEEDERGPIRSSSSRLHPSQPQPLRRQPAQLMVVPTTSSHGLYHSHPGP
jgi:hypothetical protein